MVGKFVEFFAGLEISRSRPSDHREHGAEYGATCGFFPIDDRTLDYMPQGREEDLISIVEKGPGLWRNDDVVPEYSAVVELDMGTIEPALAGPNVRRIGSCSPRCRANGAGCCPTPTAVPEPMAPSRRSLDGRGAGADPASGAVAVADPPATSVEYDGRRFEMRDGDVVVAAITSCTNTSNPGAMVGAGLS